ncbi:30S ribosomal protein S2 [Candidatus Nomurabacteria bacterium RIFCSPHIGHO2_02_FULL_38_15]|uniref:Small ribosomal subunit protein uS2 n=1 Tax=Candidatus Nomurabacteria bacterium RIFCSPHIGHO2_02_FULL_38_15 TaxID=1801752 RepID=A0A1F6VQJ1_9BACT|nr:MAG: 30S ribosomal protein S2 [Candidatus Nomurabacteria bacterium RIFCSPHIGHO2_02_FULL_38_15]
MTRIEEMFEAGVHYGYSKTRRHPSVAKFIYTTKNKNDIIDIEQTERMLGEAESALSGIANTGKVALIVGTKAEAKTTIQNLAEKYNLPYVTERWIGGVLTNWPEIKKRITKMNDLKEKREKGYFDIYTKKERLMLDREIADMEKKFYGLRDMTKTPDILIVVDPKKESIATVEAGKVNLPVIALLNTDCDLKQIDYPILGNDSSVTSIGYIMNTLLKQFDK